jgi:hypothetical protein
MIPASILRTPTRPSFFDGQLLTAADLRREQDYQDHRRHLLNLATVGAGVVTGLAVSVDPDGTGITVSPGRVPWATPDGAAPRRWGAVIELVLEPTDPVPTTDGPVSSTVSEGFAVTVVTEQPAPDDARVVIRRYDRGSAEKSRRS